ncbi:hypothetical protein MMC28_001483 [Mycoblastus sanguinarius]|nr:hypothetical protein [Mycoblastus sanguinarius]
MENPKNGSKNTGDEEDIPTELLPTSNDNREPAPVQQFDPAPSQGSVVNSNRNPHQGTTVTAAHRVIAADDRPIEPEVLRVPDRALTIQTVRLGHQN